jgi:hypothetical protein
MIEAEVSFTQSLEDLMTVGVLVFMLSAVLLHEICCKVCTSLFLCCAFKHFTCIMPFYYHYLKVPLVHRIMNLLAGNKFYELKHHLL